MHHPTVVEHWLEREIVQRVQQTDADDIAGFDPTDCGLGQHPPPGGSSGRSLMVDPLSNSHLISWSLVLWKQDVAPW